MKARRRVKFPALENQSGELVRENGGRMGGLGGARARELEWGGGDFLGWGGEKERGFPGAS